ncbi:pseudouridine synthase [Fontisphaera persica]|uniref:pseudouridine synthase n=1 Tax=Fontisphaera persica TaxID=2974023 RepID=UPI0024C00989|nr:pseudouridine synthase [Fontisphaera persica]WCJ59167.1 pseudouridine synthase [Fontisphaera persica]
MAVLVSGMETRLPPCVLFEDEHLLVVHKPPGVNTHAPAPYAGEGLYDWLRHREPRWGGLAIIHRLDKETSGVMVFAKTTLACQSLTAQFTRREVLKRYLFLTQTPPRRKEWTMRSAILRAGEKYTSRTAPQGAPIAETHFRLLEQGLPALVEARPRTGHTHQIRVHAADSGCPILGDVLYGGPPAPRVCLHAAEIVLRHPATGQPQRWEISPDFSADPAALRRAAFIHDEETNAFRRWHGAADGHPGVYLEQWGDFWLAQAESAPSSLPAPPGGGLYFKPRLPAVRGKAPAEVAPRHLAGRQAPPTFVVRENGVSYEISFAEGCSVGLFLDQRDNRRRLLTGHVARDFPLYLAPSPREVLNVFAYTCAFSVCAALGGARAVSLDLSRKYLDWGRRNFILNQLDPAAHDFIYGDAFSWLKRLARKGRQFDVLILDPPTFSQSREHGVFRVEKDYPALVQLALPLLRRGGVLLASANTASLLAARFVDMVRAAIARGGRAIHQEHYVPQPPDFPISREEPGYLKTLWLRLN